MARFKVKITVLKCVEPEYIFNGNVPSTLDGKKYTVCEVFKEGDEFIVEKNGSRPKGFCGDAWMSIYPEIKVLSWGGDFEPWIEKPKMIACCTDGIRPVSFILERIEN
jgi:uncharacterized repeat protein (TIGR04076 family)